VLQLTMRLSAVLVHDLERPTPKTQPYLATGP
jgi:hypothetical protein